MKWTKSIIGDIAFIKTNATREESIKQIPKNARLGKRWELLKICDEDKEAIKIFPRDDYILTKPRACWLDYFSLNSNFYASGRSVDYGSALRGVFVVKKRYVFSEGENENNIRYI